MRIAIIGAGISGMATAWFLQQDHEVTLFEREREVGGHVGTVPVVLGDQTVYAETGPRFYFDISSPYLLALLRILGVPMSWCEARLAFTDCARGHTLVLPPGSVRQVGSLLRSPQRFRHVLSLHRFTESAAKVASSSDWTLTLRQYLKENRYPDSFGPELIYPFLAASWGAPIAQIPEFPVYSLLKVMRRSPGQKPGFYELAGGMARYMDALRQKLDRVELHRGTGVRRISHDGDFLVEDDHGRSHHFDQIVLGTSSRDAATLLAGLPPAADLFAVIRRFRHFDTDIVVHGDPSFMPQRRADWSHMNLFHEGEHAWMTDWSGWRQGLPVFRTWLPPHRKVPELLYGRRQYHHLLMSPENAHMQRQIAALQGRAGVWVVGMYTVDVDNHESALLSAIPLAQALAPKSASLHHLLGAVSPERGHDLSILPRPERA